MLPEENRPGAPQRTERGSNPPENPKGRVLCRFGIHAGWFPVGGMRLGDARFLLAPLLDIDPKAKAIVDGRIVDEDFVIHENVDLLSFVKPSSIMGG